MKVDNSMIAAYCKCQYYYGIRYERFRATKAVKPALDVGLAAHEFARLYFTGQDTSEYYAGAVQSLLALDIEPEKVGIAVGQFMACCTVLAEQYTVSVDANNTVLIYGKDAKGVYPRWIVRDAEIAFQFPLSDKHDYMGRIDLIVEDGNGHIWLPDLKTSGFASQPTWREHWKLASQLRGYCYAASIQLGNPIAGAVIIPIATATRSERGQKYGTANFTSEIELRYDEHDLELWRVETLGIISEMETSRLHPTGKYSGNCSNLAFGRCEFFEHCQTGYNEQMLLQDTEEKIWNPLA